MLSSDTWPFGGFRLSPIHAFLRSLLFRLCLSLLSPCACLPAYDVTRWVTGLMVSSHPAHPQSETPSSHLGQALGLPSTGFLFVFPLKLFTQSTNVML